MDFCRDYLEVMKTSHPSSRDTKVSHIKIETRGEKICRIGLVCITEYYRQDCNLVKSLSQGKFISH